MSDAKKSDDDALDAVANVMAWGILFGFIVLAVAHGYYLWKIGAWINEPDKLGQLGDFIGGVTNPLLSFIGLIALFITVILQTKQLQLSRKELEATREELAKSATAQQATADVMSKQLRQAERAAEAQIAASTHQRQTAGYMRLQANYNRLAARAQVLSVELDAIDFKLANRLPFRQMSDREVESVEALGRQRAQLLERLEQLAVYLDDHVDEPSDFIVPRA